MINLPRVLTLTWLLAMLLFAVMIATGCASRPVSWGCVAGQVALGFANAAAPSYDMAPCEWRTKGDTIRAEDMVQPK